ncbi:MAG: ABC-ATPase domain-containing protein [Gemmatimonadota bacterium]
MQDRADLRREIISLDGQGYRSYKTLAGEYAIDRFTLRIDHVQGDPFADPSRMRALVPPRNAGLPAEILQTPARRISAADFLNRTFHRELAHRSRDRGSGRSGELKIMAPAQEVLHRTSVILHADGSIEARFRAGLPAKGRTVLGPAGAELLCEDVPAAVEAGLFCESLDVDALLAQVRVVEDAQAMRDQLAARRLVAFVADGAVLPRQSGIDDRPLSGDKVVPFKSPEGLRVTLDSPHGGPIAGLGVPEGVTLLVGGGFHGKSTLLRAIERGVYDHIPGDGRERVVTRPDAVKVRAEDGRSIVGTDISNFIADLPGGEDTRFFQTGNASGSTSQASAIAEALEVGARCLLLDEDTSATNFMIRDARMQALIGGRDEPITPFIDRLDDLRNRGVSAVVVVGGSGDYFEAADTVIALRAYEPREVTGEARELTRTLPTRRAEEGRAWTDSAGRVPQPGSIDPRRGNRPVRVRAFGPHRLAFGEQEIDLSALEQLVESGQTRAIARALAWARGECIDGSRTMDDALACVLRSIAEEGLDLVDDRATGDYTAFRIFEMAGVLNRLRGLAANRAQ